MNISYCFTANVYFYINIPKVEYLRLSVITIFNKIHDYFFVRIQCTNSIAFLASLILNPPPDNTSS